MCEKNNNLQLYSFKKIATYEQTYSDHLLHTCRLYCL